MKKEDNLEGIVRLSTGSWYEIITSNNEIIAARIKGKIRLQNIKSTNPVAVGDRVKFEMENDSDNGIITEILERKNYIIRKSNNLSKQTQILASNLDQLMLVATVVLPRTSTGFIDRILLTAEAYHIPTIILLNKSDLYSMDESVRETAEYYKEIYSRAGYEILDISVEKNLNLDILFEKMEDKTTLLCGHSGVGKSSLLNKVTHDIVKQKTAPISISNLKGKHTTTFAEMFQIAENTYLIDTPGIKDFGVVDLEKNIIGHYFKDFLSFINDCKFNDCQHVNEPECAIMKAVKEGKISPERYHNYLGILRNEEVKN